MKVRRGSEVSPHAPSKIPSSLTLPATSHALAMVDSSWPPGISPWRGRSKPQVSYHQPGPRTLQPKPKAKNIYKINHLSPLFLNHPIFQMPPKVVNIYVCGFYSQKKWPGLACSQEWWSLWKRKTSDNLKRQLIVIPAVTFQNVNLMWSSDLLLFQEKPETQLFVWTPLPCKCWLGCLPSTMWVTQLWARLGSWVHPHQ